MNKKVIDYSDFAAYNTFMGLKQKNPRKLKAGQVKPIDLDHYSDSSTLSGENDNMPVNNEVVSITKLSLQAQTTA